MKKSVALLIVLAVLSCFFAGCSWIVDTPAPPPDVTYTVELSDTELAMDVFDTASLSATVKNNDGEVVEDQNILWSSNNPEVVTVDNGKLDAISKGTAVITASVGESSASCTVTVDALVRPQLLVPEPEMHLAKNEQRGIIPSVKFKSATLDEALYDITYKFSSTDESVATVSADGKVTAVGVGEAEILVTANIPRATSAGIDGNLSKTVKITVLANFSMSIGVADGESSVIYLQGGQDGEAIYKDSSKLNVIEATYEGQDVKGNVTFLSSDTEILLVSSDGVVTLAPTAKVGDKATVYCQYISESEGAINSNSVEFTVDKAVVTKPVDEELILDLSNDETGLNIDELFGSEFGVLGVYDLEDQTKNNLWNAEAGKLDATKVTLLGNRTLVIEGEKISYKLNLLLVSKIITTIDEFTDIFYSSSKINEIKADGYYILGNNIDASALSVVPRGWYSGDGCGLVGTFDGRGYTVDGMTMSSGGIFGVVSSTAIVKNVAFTNVSVNAPTGHAEVLGYAVLGTVENCYFGINKLSTGYLSGTIGLFAQANDKNSLKNVVVVANCDIEIPEGFGKDKWGILEAAANKGAWENVFVVSSDRLFGGASAGDTGTQYSKSVQRFASMKELLESDYYNEKKVAYSESIWDLSTMTFKSSKDILSAELNALPSERELSMGEAVALLNNYNTCIITVNSDKLTLSDGKVVANALITPADGAKVTIVWGEITKEIAITTKNEVSLNQTINLNDANQKDIVISGVPTGLTTVKVYIAAVDGTEVELEATCQDGVVTITKAALDAVDDTVATGVGEMRLVLEGNANYYVKDVTFVWVINTASEVLKMKEHLTLNGTTYSGLLALGQDIDLAGVTIANTGLTNSHTFAGEFDGRNYTISNLSAVAGNIGLFTNVSGTIKNLRVVNGTVNTYSALLVGAALSGTIENVYVSGSIIADGMGAASNLSNFGCGLVAGRITSSAKINNVIVELISITDGLRLGTAFGKLHGGTTTEGVFTNCYAVNADACTFMPYNQGWEKKSFTEGGTNANFDTMYALWTTNESAKSLAESLGIAEPREPHVCQNPCEVEDCGKCTSDCEEAECVNNRCPGHVLEEVSVTVSDLLYYANDLEGKDFVVTSDLLTGTVSSVTVAGIEVGGSISGGVLTIPASAMKADTMPSGAVTIVVTTDAAIYTVDGAKVVWVINTASDILKMRNHLTTTDNANYTGLLALGQDIDLAGVTVKNHGWTNNMTFAGEFDGRNYTLSNISLPSNSGNIGLFSNVSGIIKNVKVVNGTVSSYTALLVGGSLTGTVENVYVNGSITADGMGAASNLSNFGSGLLAGKINAGAKVNKVIVELTSIADGLRLGTAFGKLHGGSATESVFTNCYAVNAADCTFMPYNQGWVKMSFTTGATNANFDTMADLWANETAAALATSLGLVKPEAPVEPDVPMEKTEVEITVDEILYYANQMDGADLVISNEQLTGTVSSVTVGGVTVSGSIADGKLTIPASAMKSDAMPSGAVVIVVETEANIYTISGVKVVWVINTASDILKMKNHLTTADSTNYTGLLALGQDIDLAGVTIKNSGMLNTTFAGEFDGRNYALSNIAANTGNIGLFSNVSGTIKNLKVTGTVSANTALVVGGALTGTIENVYVSGSITKDGMSASSNLANFGAGLLAGRIQSTAKINNAIVELTSIADGLRLGTAFGKLHGTNNEGIFTNCYAVNAADCTFMPYNQGWVKANFATGGTNANFAAMSDLWANEAAAAIATSLGLSQSAE